MRYKKKQDMSELPLEKQRERAFDYCIWHLSRMDQTEKFLRDKMKSKNYDSTVVDETIFRLQESNYLNDERYAELYMERESVRALGSRAVSQKLRDKGISEDKIQELLDERSEDEERESALEIAEKKVNSYSEDLPYDTKKRRLIGLLSRKGFSGDIVFSVVNEVL